MSRRKRSDPRPASSGEEWIGGCLQAPFFIAGDDEPLRPRIALWLERPADRIVAQAVVPPEEASGALARTLRNALERPLAGPLRRPALIRVADAALAEEVRAAARGIPVEVAPTPELDEAIASLAAFMPEGDEPESYFESGRVSEDAVAELFGWAELLYRAAPWKVGEDGHLLRMDIPALGVAGACVSIIGALGESIGLLIFPSLEGYEAFLEVAMGPRPKRGAPIDFGTEVLSLEFERGADLPASMRREVAAHGWPVASASAYPRVTAREHDGLPRPLVERELRIASACARALAGFFPKHRALFESDEIDEAVSETWTDESGIGVRLTLPYEAFPLFEEEGVAEGDTDTGADAMPNASDAAASTPRSGVGRNASCPCGSGKKYKKCHLQQDEASPARSEARSPSHDLDNWVTHEIFRFAVRRFGAEWERCADVFEDTEGVMQLAVPWSVYDCRVRGRTAADWYLQERGSRIGRRESAWIAAQQSAWLSVWEVEQVEPGVGIMLRDLLTLEARRVREVLGSQSLVRRDAVLARVVDWEGTSLLCGMYPRALPPREAAAVVERARQKLRRKGVVPIERLRDDSFGRHLIARWEEALAELILRSQRPLALRNTSGDPFLLTTDHFAIEAGAEGEVRARLSTLEGVEPPAPEDDPQAYVFLAPEDPRSARPGRTILGRALLAGRELRVETTSRRRADTLRGRIEGACGGSLRHRAREHSDPLSEKVAATLASNARAPVESAPPPEAQQFLLEWKQRYYAGWLDERIPALGGSTPRQAARTKQGRARLDLLLREMEHHEQRAPGAAFDFGELRRELGIE